MPIYEYRCQGCGHQFETIVGGSTRPQCPECQGNGLEKLLSVFAVGAQSQEMAPASGCGTCGDPRGPGACQLD